MPFAESNAQFIITINNLMMDTHSFLLVGIGVLKDILYGKNFYIKSD